MHSHNIVHGNLKPSSIVRADGRFKLVDLEASVEFQTDFVGSKFNSAYCPPEFVFADGTSLKCKTFALCHTTHKPLTAGLPYSLVHAHASFDVWSYAAVMFELFTASRLFPANLQDNLEAAELQTLRTFGCDFKHQKMQTVDHFLARNLVSQLLEKDPAVRQNSMDVILTHPFLSLVTPVPTSSGDLKQAVVVDLLAMADRVFCVFRVFSDSEGRFDVFLCYRASSDLDHANAIYTMLTSIGLKVW